MKLNVIDGSGVVIGPDSTFPLQNMSVSAIGKPVLLDFTNAPTRCEAETSICSTPKVWGHKRMKALDDGLSGV